MQVGLIHVLCPTIHKHIACAGPLQRAGPSQRGADPTNGEAKGLLGSICGSVTVPLVKEVFRVSDLHERNSLQDLILHPLLDWEALEDGQQATAEHASIHALFRS